MNLKSGKHKTSKWQKLSQFGLVIIFLLTFGGTKLLAGEVLDPQTLLNKLLGGATTGQQLSSNLSPGLYVTKFSPCYHPDSHSQMVLSINPGDSPHILEYRAMQNPDGTTSHWLQNSQRPLRDPGSRIIIEEIPLSAEQAIVVLKEFESLGIAVGPGYMLPSEAVAANLQSTFCIKDANGFLNCHEATATIVPHLQKAANQVSSIPKSRSGCSCGGKFLGALMAGYFIYDWRNNGLKQALLDLIPTYPGPNVTILEPNSGRIVPDPNNPGRYILLPEGDPRINRFNNYDDPMYPKVPIDFSAK